MFPEKRTVRGYEWIMMRGQRYPILRRLASAMNSFLFARAASTHREQVSNQASLLCHFLLHCHISFEDVNFSCSPVFCDNLCLFRSAVQIGESRFDDPFFCCGPQSYSTENVSTTRFCDWQFKGGFGAWTFMWWYPIPWCFRIQAWHLQNFTGRTRLIKTKLSKKKKPSEQKWGQQMTLFLCTKTCVIKIESAAAASSKGTRLTGEAVCSCFTPTKCKYWSSEMLSKQSSWKCRNQMLHLAVSLFLPTSTAFVPLWQIRLMQRNIYFPCQDKLQDIWCQCLKNGSVPTFCNWMSHFISWTPNTLTPIFTSSKNARFCCAVFFT